MSLFGALSSSVTGLAAQGEAISVISDNLANTNTVGYKASRALFSQMVTSAGVSGTVFNSGGVSTDIQRAQNIQGALQSTSSATDLALSGSGFFVLVNNSTVGPDTSRFYTRAGSFTENALGYLQHPSGNYLLGWKTDSAGQIKDIQNPQPIELQTVSSSASPTNKLDLGITLNANTDIYNYDSTKDLAGNLNDIVATPTKASYVSDERFYDAQGGARDISIGYVKRSDNVWDYVAFTDGENVVDGVKGTNAKIGSGTLIFKEDGSLESVTGNELNVPWSGGVPAGDVTLNFGDFKGGFVFEQSQLTGALAMQKSRQTVDITTSADYSLNLPNTLDIGHYTVEYKGANDYVLHLPDGSTTAAITVAPGNTGNFNVGGTNVPLTIGVAPAGPGNILESSVESVGGILSSYMDEDQYYAKYGDTATILGDYNYAWNSTTGQIELTDPEGNTYAQSINMVTPETKIIEFENGVSLTLDASWTPPSVSMPLGTLSPNNVTPKGTGVGTDGALQLASSNNVRFSIQNGFGAGELSSITVDKEGYVIGSFTNGETNKLFKLVVGVFQNPAALSPVSGNLFTQTEASGLPLNKEAGIGGTATVVSGALEQSTVDIANEFSQLIVTQRAYQANSKVVTTVDKMLNDLLSLR